YDVAPESYNIITDGTRELGVSHEIVPGLAAAMKDLAKGDKFEVTLPPAAAFGDRNDEYLLTLDREIFMRDGELAEEVKEGAILPMMTAEGYRVQGVVTEVGDKIKMDFNHPFAGLTVRYEGKVEEVRDATPEELQPSKGCGGGCGGGCDCGSEGDCATGCGGGSCGSCH
ncbi:MAG: hypothetical protein K2L68_00285, partial [Muribaculaceae bacterium]|nr:hypothetical protein [Muribaculaceae bacterium]